MTATPKQLADLLSLRAVAKVTLTPELPLTDGLDLITEQIESEIEALCRRCWDAAAEGVSFELFWSDETE